MKTSVLIVAHNEEKIIGKCLASVFEQTMKPDEVVVIVHNASDRTFEIANSFAAEHNVKVIDYKGPDGVPFARIKGFEIVSGGIIACLDGDSIAEKNWLKNLTAPLADPKVSIVGGYAILTNNMWSHFVSFWQFRILRATKQKMNYFAWGSNFACRKADYEKVGGFTPIIGLKETLPLYFWAEDFYISLALMKIGKIRFATNARSYTKLPSWKLNIFTAPNNKWYHDNRKLTEYFSTLP
ncbi:MAG TPA: glycosyltransferase family 2 protein [Candidatus Paceibacterota bacterium]|nr:glycosyltransferase family 2 protein [Candidatus Paceibacterota bacterium]